MYSLAVCPSVVYIRICSPRPLMKSIQNSCSAFTNKQAGIHALACQLSTGSSLSGRFPGVLQRPSSFLVYRTDKITLLFWCGRWPLRPKVQVSHCLKCHLHYLSNTRVSRRDAGNAVPPLVLDLSVYLCTNHLLLTITSSFSLIILWLAQCHFQGKEASICWWSDVLILFSFSKSFSSPPNTPCLRLFSCELLLFSKSSLDGSLEFL